MKKIFIPFAAFAVALVSLFSCTGSTGNGSELDSLRVRVAEQDSLLKDAEQFTQLMNTSMDSVIMADGSIIFNMREGVKPTREQMKDNLEAYKMILDQQRQRIAELEASLKNNKSAHAAQMREVIEKLTAQLDAKELQIADLEKKLADSKITIEELQGQVEELSYNVTRLSERTEAQEETINAQNDKMSEGYYIIATKKELKDLGILTGAGLFKNSKLDMSVTDVSKFKKIDVRTQNNFLIPGTDPKVLTQAPSDSYTITKDGKNSVLTVTNANRFWSMSKYLVIQY